MSMFVSSCDAGFRLLRSTTRVASCTSHGWLTSAWADDAPPVNGSVYVQPQCQATTTTPTTTPTSTSSCQALTLDTHMTATYSNISTARNNSNSSINNTVASGMSVTLTCMDGFVMRGGNSSDSTCGTDGKWTPDVTLTRCEDGKQTPHVHVACCTRLSISRADVRSCMFSICVSVCCYLASLCLLAR